MCMPKRVCILYFANHNAIMWHLSFGGVFQIHCSPDEVSLVDNATTAAVVVAQRMQWLFVEEVYEKGKDAVLLLNFCYGYGIHVLIACP